MSRSAAVLAAALVLAGCQVLPTEPPALIYDLQGPAAVQPDAGQPLPLTVVVTAPSAIAAIDSDRIAIRTSPHELRFYADARWSDSAPRLLQTLLQSALADSGRFTAVVRDSGAPGAVVLAGDLRSFEAQARGAETHAVVRLDLRLASSAERRILTTRSFTGEARAATDTPVDVAAAFQQVLETMLPAIAQWTADAAAAPAGS